MLYADDINGKYTFVYADEKMANILNIKEKIFLRWDFIEYGRVTQDSYVSELFPLNNNLLIYCNYFPKSVHIQRKL